MRRILLASSIVLGIILGVGIGSRLPRAKAQLSTSISVGANINTVINGEQYVAVPACSKAAGCISSLQICNEVNGKADSTRCVFVPTTYGPLWLGVSETISGATNTTTPYQIGTLYMTVPQAEVNQTP